MQPSMDVIPLLSHTLECLAVEVSNLKTSLVESLMRNGQAMLSPDNAGFNSSLLMSVYHNLAITVS